MKKLFTVALLALLVACSETNRNPAPVELIATANQEQFVFDLLDPNLSGHIGTIQVRAVTKNTSSTVPNDPRYLDVKLINYRVTYTRADGGTVVPASFVRTLSGIVAVGGTSQSLNDFFAFTTEALSQAPFIAILPNNGGVDPETGQNLVKLNVITDIFGETLSGQPVSARVVQSIWVCAGCTLH
jgi:hypothetical protein